MERKFIHLGFRIITDKDTRGTLDIAKHIEEELHKNSLHFFR